MFDVGFSELFVIAIVALLVLGPERLPKAARFAGLWMRRARAQWYSVKSELENELADDELKRDLLQTRDQLQGEMRQLRDSLQHGAQAVRGEFEKADPASAATASAAANPPDGGTLVESTLAVNTPLETTPIESAPVDRTPDDSRSADDRR